MAGHKLAREFNYKEETYTLIELSQFLLKLNNLIFPIQICIIPMLRDTADGHISSFNHLRIKVAEILTLKLINGEEINLF